MRGLRAGRPETAATRKIILLWWTHDCIADVILTTWGLGACAFCRGVVRQHGRHFSVSTLMATVATIVVFFGLCRAHSLYFT